MFASATPAYPANDCASATAASSKASVSVAYMLSAALAYCCNGIGVDNELSAPAATAALANVGQRLSERMSGIDARVPACAAARQGPDSSSYWRSSSAVARSPVATTVMALSLP